MNKIIYLVICCSILIMIIFSCNIDHGLTPKDYMIKGNVIFFKGEAPENTDRVEVFALKEFPPEDPQNFLYLGRSGALDYQNRDTVSYEIHVSPTSYQLIGAVWKEKGENWNLTGLIGLYTGNTFSFLPDSVVVTDDNAIIDSVDFYANWQIVSKSSSIAGKIIYEGNWPEDTSYILLAIYRIKPNSDIQYIAFENVDYTQPLFVKTSSYKLAVNSGTYNYIVIYWVGKTIKKLQDLIEIGYYRNPENPDTPARLQVLENEHRENVDIHVNFNNIEFP